LLYNKQYSKGQQEQCSSTHYITTNSIEGVLQAASPILYSSKLRLALSTHMQLNMLGMQTWL